MLSQPEVRQHLSLICRSLLTDIEILHGHYAELITENRVVCQQVTLRLKLWQPGFIWTRLPQLFKIRNSEAVRLFPPARPLRVFFRSQAVEVTGVRDSNGWQVRIGSTDVQDNFSLSWAELFSANRSQ
jgi:hypothetical protein